MDKENVSCSICMEAYNTSEHEPRIVPGCGHTICLECVKAFVQNTKSKFECPFCKKTVNMRKRNREDLFVKNFALLSVIEEDNLKAPQETQVESCSLHQRPLDLICKDCEEKICYQCAFNPAHKGHSVDMIGDFYQNAGNMATEVDHWMNQVHQHNTYLENCIQIKQDYLEDMGELLKEECIEKINSIVDDYMVNMKRIFKGLRDGQLIKLFGKNEDFLFSEDKIYHINEKVKKWKLTRSIKDGLAVSRIDVAGLRSILQKYQFGSECRGTLDAIGKTLLNVVSLNLTNAMQNVSEKFEQRNRFSSHFWTKLMFEKKSSEIKVGKALKKLPRSKIVNSKNVFERVSQARKVSLDLREQPLKEEFLSDIESCFWAPNEVKSLQISLSDTCLEAKNGITQLFADLPCFFETKVLHLSMQNMPKLTTEDLIGVFKGIQLMNLRRLDLAITNNANLNDKSVKDLAFAILKSKKLKNLDLSMSGCTEFGDAELTRLCTSFSVLYDISEFKLSIDGCTKVGLVGFQNFTQSILYWGNLQKLQLNLSNMKLLDADMRVLCMTISYLVKLIGFKLNCDGNESITDETITLVSDSIEDLLDLKEVEFSFKGTSVQSFAITSLGEILKFYPGVKNLRVDPEERRVDQRNYELIQGDDVEEISSVSDKKNGENEEDGEDGDSDDDSDLDSDNDDESQEEIDIEEAQKEVIQKVVVANDNSNQNSNSDPRQIGEIIADKSMIKEEDIEDGDKVMFRQNSGPIERVAISVDFQEEDNISVKSASNKSKGSQNNSFSLKKQNSSKPPPPLFSKKSSSSVKKAIPIEDTIVID